MSNNDLMTAGETAHPLRGNAELKRVFLERLANKDVDGVMTLADMTLDKNKPPSWIKDYSAWEVLAACQHVADLVTLPFLGEG